MKRKFKSLHARWILFKWIVSDSFRYLFIRTCATNMAEIEDDVFRMKKLDPNRR